MCSHASLHRNPGTRVRYERRCRGLRGDSLYAMDKGYTPPMNPGLRRVQEKASSVADSVVRPQFPNLEVHVPISPTSTMFNMAHSLVLSLRRNGGAYAGAPVVITVGDGEYPQGLIDAP